MNRAASKKGNSYQLTASQPALSPVLHHFTILFQKVPLLSLKKRPAGNDGTARGLGGHNFLSVPNEEKPTNKRNKR
jgi:hypothetical protein